MGKNDLKVAFTYVGAVVGAGFASGQELVKFFVIFQNYGQWGTIITGGIFAFLGAVVIMLVNKLESKDYGQLLKNIFPYKIYKFMDITIAISLWLGVGVMLAGSSTLLKEWIHLSTIIGFIITAILVFFCLQLGSKGLLNTNTVLVPFLIILAIGCSMLQIIKPVLYLNEEIKIQSLLPNWWIASLLYVAYNMILGIVVIASIKEKKERLTPWGGIIGGLLLGVMSFIMVKGLLLLPGNLLMVEMPMLVLTSRINPLVGKVYGIALWIALFTTALANAHSLTIRISNKTKRSYKKILAIIIISTFCFIPWRFSMLVGFIYPIEGYLAIPIIIGIIIAVFRY